MYVHQLTSLVAHLFPSNVSCALQVFDHLFAIKEGKTTAAPRPWGTPNSLSEPPLLLAVELLQISHFYFVTQKTRPRP